MRKTILPVAVAGAALCALAAPPFAAAEERTCRGTMGAVTVDNLRVPQGASCTLDRTRVKGTLQIERGARLNARRVRVIGNVQGEGARSVRVRSSRVRGGVQVVQGGSASIRNSVIGGTVLFDENRSRLVASRNRIDGDLQAFHNAGGVSFVRNRVDSNLQCKENSPAPTGGGNVVQGQKEDQCAGL